MKPIGVPVISCISILCTTSASSSSYMDYNVAHNTLHGNNNATIAKMIVVDQSGKGDFRSVQQAVDSVPSGNKYWIKIYIKNGTYNEKVEIPSDKPKIIMKGEHESRTIIQSDGQGSATQSSTFKLYAEYFVATDITFKNTHNKPIARKENETNITRASAALIDADKVVFQRCSFISIQDTLTDAMGRHYLEECYIAGAIDFIWGYGQSIYHKCVINVTGDLGSLPGYITAQGRNSSQDTSGFVFNSCYIVGSGKAYLGRAYGRFSRVFFSSSQMSNIIVPQGWSPWNNQGHENTTVYAEVNCTGPGANTKKRVKWEKSASYKDIRVLRNHRTFIDNDSWMANLPISLSFPPAI